MWAKELVTKFQKPYTTNWAMQQGVAMYHMRPEDRLDDHLVTDRKGKSKSLQMFPNAYKNDDS